jgi:hypothetical protein
LVVLSVSGFRKKLVELERRQKERRRRRRCRDESVDEKVRERLEKMEVKKKRWMGVK